MLRVTFPVLNQQIPVDQQNREGKKILEEREKKVTHAWHVFPTVKNEREMRKRILNSVVKLHAFCYNLRGIYIPSSVLLFLLLSWPLHVAI